MSAAPADRNRELAKIHVAKKELNLDDETYRAMLWTVARVKSAAELDAGGRARVIEHLHGIGFKNKSNKKNFPGRPHNTDENPQLRKIEALLTIARRPWSYVDAMAASMYDVDRIAWCNAEQLQGIIAALEFDKRRQENPRPRRRR